MFIHPCGFFDWLLILLGAKQAQPFLNFIFCGCCGLGSAALPGLADLAGELFAAHHAGVFGVGGGQYVLVRAYHTPIGCSFAQLYQPANYHLVGGQPLAYKMCVDIAKAACACLPGRGAVKIYFHLGPCGAAEILQQFHQAHLIIGRVQSPAQFGNQVMPIYQIVHIIILPAKEIFSYFLPKNPSYKLKYAIIQV